MTVFHMKIDLADKPIHSVIPWPSNDYERAFVVAEQVQMQKEYKGQGSYVILDLDVHGGLPPTTISNFQLVP